MGVYWNYQEDGMNYSTACELLGFTTPKSIAANAKLAKSALDHMTSKTPLRYKVAAQVLINAEEE